MSHIAIRRAVERADRSGSYPEAIRILMAAGVRLYHVDVLANTIVYSTDLASYTDARHSVLDTRSSPAASLDPTAVENAMRTIDRGDTDYDGFLRRLWQAGVVEYDVNLIWRQITFRGADGRTHVTAIATTEKELVRA